MENTCQSDLKTEEITLFGSFIFLAHLALTSSENDGKFSWFVLVDDDINICDFFHLMAFTKYNQMYLLEIN